MSDPRAAGKSGPTPGGLIVWTVFLVFVAVLFMWLVNPNDATRIVGGFVGRQASGTADGLGGLMEDFDTPGPAETSDEREPRRSQFNTDFGRKWDIPPVPFPDEIPAPTLPEGGCNPICFADRTADGLLEVERHDGNLFQDPKDMGTESRDCLPLNCVLVPTEPERPST